MNIRQELARRHLKIADLYRGLEVHRTTVQEWINGTTKMKRVHELAIRMWLQEQDAKK